MKTLALLTGLLCLCLAPWLFAAQESPSSAAPELSELAWLGGHWAAEIDGLLMEEQWMAPRGKSMLGMHRDVDAAGDRTVAFEFLRIIAGSKGLRLLASPSGRPPTPFELEDIGPGKVVFANPQHDFPQRILYELEEDGKVLHARVEGQGSPPLDWRWKRVDQGGWPPQADSGK